jgi:hypothetical protein
MNPPRKIAKDPATVFVNLRLPVSLVQKLDTLQVRPLEVKGVPLPKMKRSALIRWLIEVAIQAVG